MPLGQIVHSYDQDALALWNANFEEGLKVAKATDAKEVWSARGNMPTIHLMGGTIMGTEAGNSVTNSYGQTHELPNLYVAGPGIFATAGAVESDLHDLRAVAARRRAAGVELEHGRGLGCSMVFPGRRGSASPESILAVSENGFRVRGFRRARNDKQVDSAAHPALSRGSSLSAFSRSIAARSPAEKPQSAMPALTSAPSRNGKSVP